jgi:hypothetical protein
MLFSLHHHLLLQHQVENLLLQMLCKLTLKLQQNPVIGGKQQQQQQQQTLMIIPQSLTENYPVLGEAPIGVQVVVVVVVF